MTTLEVFDPPMCCSTGVCGPEPDDRLAQFSADLDWLKRRGIPVRRYNLSQEPAAFINQPEVARILLDSAAGGRGGTGRPFDWALLRGLEDPDRCILAGGLTAERIEAATATGIDFLDVSSGVESAPGIKSERLMKDLLEARRRAGTAPHQATRKPVDAGAAR